MTATGGWARELGIDPATPITEYHILWIIARLEKRVRAESDPTPGIWNPVYEQAITNWRTGVRTDLDTWMGKPIGSLPANPLDWGPHVRQTELGDVADAAGAFVAPLVAGIGEVAGNGILLVSIAGLGLMGAWLMFREPSVLVRSLALMPRRAAKAATA